MFKKLLSLTLACSMMQIAFARPVAADPNAVKEARLAEKVRVGIARLGIGTDARVEVKLKDKTKLKGYISEASADSFVVINAHTGTPITVSYPQVKQVKGHNLSSNARLAIGLGAAAALIVIFLIVLNSQKQNT